MPKNVLNRLNPKEELERKVEAVKNEWIDQVSFVIKPKDKEWEKITELQRSGELPHVLSEVRFYNIKRQYEGGAIRNKGLKVVSVELDPLFFNLNISPRFKERVLYPAYYNPQTSILHVSLKRYQTFEDFPAILKRNGYISEPKYGKR